jgi:hypothetical protein
MVHQIQFAIETNEYPADLALAAGYVIIEWSMIEESITRLLKSFYVHDPNRQPLPNAFERQADILVKYVHNLYGDGEEYAEFQRVFGQVLTIKRKRDSVAHGIPATCVYRGKTFEALWVSNWTSAKETRHLPATFSVLKALAERASILKHEWFWVEMMVQDVFLRPIHEAQQHPSMRGKPGLRALESLLKNPLRNPKPTKSPLPFPSPLRWPADTKDWQTTSPYKPPRGTVLQQVTAIVLHGEGSQRRPESSGS